MILDPLKASYLPIALEPPSPAATLRKAAYHWLLLGKIQCGRDLATPAVGDRALALLMLHGSQLFLLLHL